MLLISIVSQIEGYLAPFMPFAQAIVIFFLPIYIVVGGAFAAVGLAFIGMVPVNSALLFGIIMMVVFVVLGIILGIKMDPEKQGAKKPSPKP